MPSADELRILLENYSVDLCGPVIQYMDEGSGYYAFVNVNYRRNGRRTPSDRKLKMIREAVLKSGYNVNFVIVEEKDEDNHIDLRILLNRRYDDKIRNAFLTRAPNAKWNVWIEIDYMVDDELQSSIQSTVRDYMRLCELTVGDIIFIGNVNYPTFTAILRTLRTLAPASPENLREALRQRGFFVPDQMWLNRVLDRIRKARLVVRRKDGRYFLSGRSLSSLGTSKGREGADVRRALAVSKDLQ